MLTGCKHYIHSSPLIVSPPPPFLFWPIFQALVDGNIGYITLPYIGYITSRFLCTPHPINLIECHILFNIFSLFHLYSFVPFFWVSGVFEYCTVVFLKVPTYIWNWFNFRKYTESLRLYVIDCTVVWIEVNFIVWGGC